MGYMALMAPCFGCKRVFESNPHLVPSYQGAPICRACITKVNAKRKLNGLPEWPVLPGAYDAAEA